MNFPDRITPLIAKAAAGKLTQADLELAAMLHTLDLIKLGEDAVREKDQRDKDQIAHMQAMEEAWRAT